MAVADDGVSRLWGMLRERACRRARLRVFVPVVQCLGDKIGGQLFLFEAVGLRFGAQQLLVERLLRFVEVCQRGAQRCRLVAVAAVLFAVVKKSSRSTQVKTVPCSLAESPDSNPDVIPSAGKFHLTSLYIYIYISFSNKY